VVVGMSIFIRTVPNVMAHYGCTAEDAHRFIDLRDEGYSTEQAALMAGLTDPPEPLSAADRALADSFAGPAFDVKGERQ
jgi:hypothetical protein